MLLSELLAQNPNLDHELDTEGDDIVTDLVSLVRVVRLEGDETNDGLIIGAPDNTTGIIQYGIVGAAKLQLEQWMLNGPD